jgi:hypothetical protein
MFTETKIRATKKVNQILENLKTVDDCGAASKVIDFYEKDFSDEKDFIKYCRNFLCDKTFELYLKK